MSLNSRQLCGIAVCMLAILSGCKPAPRPVQHPTPPPKPVTTAEQNWKVLVADMRTECKRHAGCRLYYERLHKYGHRYFGITIIGHNESEYRLNLYQYNPESTAKSGAWIDSRPTSPEGPYDDAYFAATSKRWDVPEATIRQWHDEAHATVRETPPMHSRSD